MLRHWFLLCLAALALTGSVPAQARPVRHRRAVHRGVRTRWRRVVRGRRPRRALRAPVHPRAGKKTPGAAAPVRKVTVDRRSIQGLQPAAAHCMAAALLAMRRAGVIYSITSVRRSYADQERLWRNRRHNPYPVAAPGTSMHELGLAIDLTFTARGRSGRAIMQRHGFTQPVRHDPVHWEARHAGSGTRKKATGC